MRFGSILRRLLGRPDKPRHDYIESTDLFMQIDIEQTKKRLRLKEKAKRRAADEDPPTKSTSFDDVEENIVTTIETEKDLCAKTYIGHQKTYKDRFLSLDFETKLYQISQAAEIAGGSFKSNTDHGKDILFGLRRNLVRIENDIVQFKKKHGLNRLAHVPISKVYSRGIVAVFLLIEGFLNGMFLARGHEFGLLGGVGTAVAIAGINVVLLGYILGGTLLRHANHKESLGKTLAVAGLLLYLIVTTTFNLGVAHFRDALGGQNPEEAEKIALDSLVQTPFAVQDLHSWMLFLMGVGFSILAAVDGLKSDDPYPGYGDFVRRQEQINEDYIEEKRRLVENLTQIRDEAVDKMDYASKEIHKYRKDFDAITVSQERLSRSLEHHLAHLEQCANELLTFYRQTNRRFRKTDPPPHFSNRWVIPRPLLAQELIGVSPAIDQLEKLVNQASHDVKFQRRKVTNLYNVAISQYRRIEDLTPEALEND